MTSVIGTSFAFSLFLCGLAYAAEPMDSLKSGKLECSKPDAQKHTCQTLTRYEIDGSKAVLTTDGLIAPSPLITMRMTGHVTFKGSMICGFVSKEDVDAGVISVNGQRLTGATEAKIKDQMWTAAYAPRAGKEICSSYKPNGKDFTETFLLDGKPDTLPDSIIRFVDPADGYMVGP
jgi:hypothetical protein